MLPSLPTMPNTGGARPRLSRAPSLHHDAPLTAEAPHRLSPSVQCGAIQTASDRATLSRPSGRSRLGRAASLQHFEYAKDSAV